MASPPTIANRIDEIDMGDAGRFREEVAPRYRPVVIRGLVAGWPAVTAARGGDRALVDYLGGLDGGVATTVLQTPAELAGRFFYAPDMRGLNFTTQKARVRDLLGRLLALADIPDAPALYAGSTPTAQSMPGFGDENPAPLAADGAAPRIWIGNATQVATHYDMAHNIACVVAGRRRFTLFPPDQLPNLYVGPIERTPAGQPVSMVDLAAPDLDRYPRFAQALEHAAVADLGPGDAIYIPSLWWHHVRASGAINVLVNYWPPIQAPTSPFAAMMHAMFALRELPEAERAAWATWFDHYAFAPTAPDAAAHLPEHARGVLGRPSPQRDHMIRSYVSRAIAPDQR